MNRPAASSKPQGVWTILAWLWVGGVVLTYLAQFRPIFSHLIATVWKG